MPHIVTPEQLIVRWDQLLLDCQVIYNQLYTYEVAVAVKVQNFFRTDDAQTHRHASRRLSCMILQYIYTRTQVVIGILQHTFVCLSVWHSHSSYQIHDHKATLIRPIIVGLQMNTVCARLTVQCPFNPTSNLINFPLNRYNNNPEALKEVTQSKRHEKKVPFFPFCLSFVTGYFLAIAETFEFKQYTINFIINTHTYRQSKDIPCTFLW